MRPSSSANVLVLGVAPALSWKVARALQRGGYTSLIAGPAWFESLSWLPCCRGYLPLTKIRRAGHNEIDPSVIDELDAVCRRHDIDVIVPADMASTLLLSEHGHRLTSVRVFPVDDGAKLRRLHDKWQFSRIIEGLGLPQPRTEFLGAARDIPDSFVYPVLTKAVDLSNGDGIVRHQTRDQLVAWLGGAGQSHVPSIVQEYVQGPDVGVTLYAEHGRLVSCSSFFHTRQWSRTFFEHDGLRAIVEQFVEATAFHGVGHIDAIARCAGGEPKHFDLLEFNPRFAGSLLYSVRAGYNYAAMGIERLLGGAHETPGAGPSGRVRLPWSDRVLGAAATAQGRHRALWHGGMARRHGTAASQGHRSNGPP